MELLQTMAHGGHEQLVAVQDERTGLRGWIALHHSQRGPAYGGIRVWSYRNEAEAALDALRLSQTMTFKCVLAGIQGGGAKTVILEDHILDRRGAVHELGRRIQAMKGLYRAGPDAGFDANDLRQLAETTQYASAFHPGKLRPAAEATAEGAHSGICAALAHLGCTDLKGVRVSIQGMGAVGLALAKLLLADGAEVFGADPKAAACEHASRLGVRLVSPSSILRLEADVVAPCALGGILHELSIQRLNCRVVAGVANNILASSSLAELLHDRGILLIPDFVLNAGALIEGAGYERTGRTQWSDEVRGVGDTVTKLFKTAERSGLTTLGAAIAMAEKVLLKEEQAREKKGLSSVQS